MDKLVAEIIKSYPHNFAADTSITVALSGGVDSVALLHILNTITVNHYLAIKIHLDAIHINHGISANAMTWAKFCKNLCQDLNIQLTVSEHKISKNGGESLENNARIIRYKEFYKHPSNVIALAHHRTDQVETTLAQIFRGSDLHNIAAMRTLTQKQNKTFWRPLLNLTKHDLEEYVTRNNLTHIIDESNTDNQYLRNFIRNKIIPELTSWDRHIETKILRINEQIQDNLALTDEIAENDLQVCCRHYDTKYNAPEHVYNSREINCHSSTIWNPLNQIDYNKFIALSNLRQNNLLNYFILRQNKPLPSNKQITEFIRQLNTCQMDKSPSLKLNDTSEIVMQKKVIFIK